MKKLAKVPKHWISAILCLGLIGPPGCKTHDDHWSFAVSRSAYGGVGIFHGDHHGPVGHGVAVAYMAILLLPLVIDLVVLPVTATHDLLD